jgi:hypothetical protein
MCARVCSGCAVRWTVRALSLYHFVHFVPNPSPPPPTSSLLQRVCQLCQLALSIRSPKKQLMEHVDAKHSKQGYEACFPGGPTE